MIRIYVFVNGRTGNSTNTNAQAVWVDLNDHPNAEDIYVVDASNPDNAEFVKLLKVTSFPTVVFTDQMDAAKGRTITRIVGPASYDQIAQIYQSILDGQYAGGTDGTGTTPAIIPGDDKDLSLGLGLGLGGNVGKWLLLALLGYGAYRAGKK